MADASEPELEFLGDVESNGSVATDFGLFNSVEYNDTNLDEPLDTPPEFGSREERIGDGECVVCGTPTFRPPGLTKAGHKKRVPKYCDLHAPNLRVQTERPVPKGMESQLQRVQDELADDIRLLATLAGPLLPVTGMYLYGQADPFTIALIKLAKNNQTALRILHRAAQVAPIYTVAETIAGTAYAVQVDTRGADPHNAIGRRLRVGQAYEAVYGTGEESTGSQQLFTGPPKYSTVQ